jgi:hypothetical protein
MSSMAITTAMASIPENFKTRSFLPLFLPSGQTSPVAFF